MKVGAYHSGAGSQIACNSLIQEWPFDRPKWMIRSRCGIRHTLSEARAEAQGAADSTKEAGKDERL